MTEHAFQTNTVGGIVTNCIITLYKKHKNHILLMYMAKAFDSDFKMT